MSSGKLRIGILGCAGIASKTAIAIADAASCCVVAAVASRSLAKAERFVADFLPADSTAKALGGPDAYETLIQSDVVDAMYIPLPTAVKKQWVLKALLSGKHVVLEKPVALSAGDYEEFLRAAYSTNKFILDGTMFPHHKRTETMLEYAADEHNIGQVDRVESSFSFMTDDAWEDDNIRAQKGGDPQGCIGDLGWYCICHGLMVFRKLGCKAKSAQVVSCDFTKHGVPRDATCVVRFESNKVLWFHCSFKVAFRQRFEVCGSKKIVTIDDLVLPTQAPNSFLLSSSSLTDHDLLTVPKREIVKEPECEPVQEVKLWKEFSRIARALDESSNSPDDTSKWTGEEGIVKTATDWASISWMNQRVVDALMESTTKDFKVVEI